MLLRILFNVVMGLHGLIHSIAFVKAFNLAEIKELKQPISKPAGLIWLLVFLLFTAATVQYSLGNEFWWSTAILGVLVSQVLVIVFWSEAKFGTLPNVVILIVAIVAFTHFNFDRMVSREIDEIFSKVTVEDNYVITTDIIEHLPAPVQKWITNSGIIGRENIYAVRLKQKAFMKMKPEQKDWNTAYAEQYYTVDKPAFLWKVNMTLMPLVDIVGRDKLVDGKGSMLVKILSLFPVVNSSDNEKINTGTMQRYLGEVVWFPTAALSPYITWEAVDTASARATMTYKGTSVSGIFRFDEEGNFVEFRTKRFRGSGEGAVLEAWVISARENKLMNGVTIPVKLDATWKLEGGDWTWLLLEVTDIEYNKLRKY